MGILVGKMWWLIVVIWYVRYWWFYMLVDGSDLVGENCNCFIGIFGEFCWLWWLVYKIVKCVVGLSYLCLVWEYWYLSCIGKSVFYFIKNIIYEEKYWWYICVYICW